MVSAQSGSVHNSIPASGGSMPNALASPAGSVHEGLHAPLSSALVQPLKAQVVRNNKYCCFCESHNELDSA